MDINVNLGIYLSIIYANIIDKWNILWLVARRMHHSSWRETIAVSLNVSITTDNRHPPQNRHRCSVSPSFHAAAWHHAAASRYGFSYKLHPILDKAGRVSLLSIRIHTYTLTHACIVQLALYDSLITVAKLSHESQSAPAAKIAV